MNTAAGKIFILWKPVIPSDVFTAAGKSLDFKRCASAVCFLRHHPQNFWPRSRGISNSVDCRRDAKKCGGADDSDDATGKLSCDPTPSLRKASHPCGA